MRTHSVWLSTAPKLEKCVTCRRWICYVYVMYIFFFSLFSSLCLVMLDHRRRYFCITQATRLWMFVSVSLATESVLFLKNHFYTLTVAWHFFSLFWNHERHEQRNRVTTVLGSKQEGLTIVHFLNKLIISCKEAVRFPF